MRMNYSKMLGGLMALAFFIGIFSTPQFTRAADIHSYPTIAVMQFSNKAITSSGMRAFEFDSASEYAIYQLLASGWFDIIDYGELSKIADIHEINMSGVVNPATAVQLGQIAGAQFMVVGSVTGLTTKKSGLDYNHGRKGGLDVDVRTVTANVVMRIVDIETGRIVAAGLGKGESTSTGAEIKFKRYRKNSSDTYEELTTETTTEGTTDELYTSDTEEVTETVTDTEVVATDTETTDTSSTDITTTTTEETSESTDYYTDDSYYDETQEVYSIRIGTEEFSAVQVRNAIGKAVRDAIYGNTGLMTMLNNGKKLKVKTGF